MGDTAPEQSKTVITLFRTLIAADPARPALTYYDQPTGERAELSGATLDNWVAKTANLLVDGLGLGTGDVATVWLPPHWQTAAVLLGCWTAGLTVRYGAPDAADAQVLFASAEIVAAAPDRLSAPVPDRYVLGLAPLGQPLAEVPAGWSDYIAESRGHGDRYPGPHPGPDDPARIAPDGTPVSHAELRADACGRAAALGVPAGGRVLIDGEAHPDPVEWLLAPLAVGTSIVLVLGLARSGPAPLAGSERATLLPRRAQPDQPPAGTAAD